MTKIFSIIILIGLLWGCSNNKNPGGVLSKEKMVIVMWDIIGASTYTQHFIKKDSLKNSFGENRKLQQQIFALHKVSKDEFYKSYEYYSSKPEQMRTILDSITIRGERERMKMIEKYNTNKFAK